MLTLALKWMMIALVTLTVFSALTSLYGLYQLNIGACSDGCERAPVFAAYTQVGLIGIVGFGVSAYAAHRIGKSFSQGD